MSKTWGHDETVPLIQPTGPIGAVLGFFRGALVGVGTYSCLILLLIVRAIEAPIFGVKRPVTPWITQFVCRTAFIGLGVQFSIIGKPMSKNGAIVANHVSWLDIFALNAPQRVYFVSKSEVANWPGIGWLARATGTVFIARKSTDAAKQRQVFQQRLMSGHKLVFFPEGTSSDGIRVLPFKSTLFAAFFDKDLVDDMHIQPVTLVYHAPAEQDPRFYGWWAEMEFGPHLVQVLTARRQGRIEVVFHEPVAVADFSTRKELAKYCEAKVAEGLLQHLAAASTRAQISAGVSPAAR